METGLQVMAAALIVLAVGFVVVAVRRGRRFEAVEAKQAKQDAEIAELRALLGSDDRIGELLSPPEQDRHRRGFGVIRGSHAAIPLALVIFTATSALALWFDGDRRRGSEVAESTTTMHPPRMEGRVQEPLSESDVRESPQPLTATATEDVPAPQPYPGVPPERGQQGSGGLAVPSPVSPPPLPDVELPDVEVPDLPTTTSTSVVVDPPACVAEVQVFDLDVSVCAAS